MDAYDIYTRHAPYAQCFQEDQRRPADLRLYRLPYLGGSLQSLKRKIQIAGVLTAKSGMPPEAALTDCFRIRSR